jgi:hypothetical protein
MNKQIDRTSTRNHRVLVCFYLKNEVEYLLIYQYNTLVLKSVYAR